MAINAGSFGAAIGGGGSAIAEAMQNRGMDPGVLNQISPTSASAPDQLPPQPIGAGAPAIPQRQPLPGPGQPGGVPSTESSIIIKALDSRLKSLSKLQEMGIQV